MVLRQIFLSFFPQKEQLLMEQKDLLNGKMQRAEEKRRLFLEGIRKKAHMEEAKQKVKKNYDCILYS